MRPRRPRLLSREEAHLWGEIAKLITPLRGRAKPKKPPPDVPMPPSPAPRPGPAPSSPPRPAPAARPPATLPSRPGGKAVKLGDLAVRPRPAKAAPPPAPPAPPGLERRERRGLERGTLAIEARIDLHGLYQAEAHAALVGFLIRARAAGHARVLVVTGKGGEGVSGSDRGGFQGGFSERGVLRRSVPHWLRGPELRGLVLGFEEAARHHGGGGALYVRLKRR